MSLNLNPRPETVLSPAVFSREALLEAARANVSVELVLFAASGTGQAGCRKLGHAVLEFSGGPT